MSKFTALFICLSTFLSAQKNIITDTIATPIYTLQLQKKERNRELYIHFYSPNLSAQDQKAYDFPYIVRPEVDTVFYRYQDFNQYQYHFIGTRGLTIGFSKKYRLDHGVYFRSGFAFDIFGFQYNLTKSRISTSLLTEYHKKIPTSPQVITAFEINKESNYSNFPDIEIVKPINHIIASLMLPFGVDFKLSNRSFIGIDVKVRLPVSATVEGSYVHQGMNVYIQKESNVIARISSNFGLYFKYNLTERFFLEANGNIGWGIFNFGTESYPEYRALQDPKLYAYGLKAGINY